MKNKIAVVKIMKKIFYKYFIPFILVALLPVLLSGLCIFYAVNMNVNEMKQKIIRQSIDVLKTEISYKNEAITGIVGREIEEQISKIDYKILAMSLSSIFKNMDLEKIKLYCNTILYETPFILEISVVNKRGEEIFKISRDVAISEEDYKDLSNEIGFKSIQKRQFYVSDVNISEITYLPYVSVARPVEQYKGKFEGGIFAKVDLGFIWDIVAGKEVGEKGFLYIISDKGMLIAHPSKKEIYENPEYYKYAYIKKILGTQKGTILKEDNLLSFSTNKYSWKTLVEIPLEEAMQSVEKTKNTISDHIRATFQSIGISSLVIVILIIITLVPIGIGITKNIVNPILSLTAAAEEISKGNLLLKVDIATNDEINDLANSFNKMAEELNASIQKEKELAAIASASADAERAKTNELENAYNKLEKSNQELKEATVQLVQSEKLSALGELTAGVAHELNQPLNGIKIISQSILRDIQRDRFEEEELEPDLNEVVNQVNKMAEIIDHMRIYTRRTEGTPEEMIDVNSVVEGAFKFLGQQLKNHNIDVVKELREDLPPVIGDVIRLEQVFLNLITNARNALEDSGKEHKSLQIKTYLPVQGTQTSQNGNLQSASDNHIVVVEVTDNGVGIPEDVREKIFQPFFTTKEPGKGTGLGLSVASKIIEEHNGRIEVESQVGEGTTFRVMLPTED